MFALFQELQRYVGFGEDDKGALRDLHPTLSVGFPQLAEAFLKRALEFEEAKATLDRGEKSGTQLKASLVQWLNELFLGPWDEAYVERRMRVGRVHVQIGLPQHFLVSAMSFVRQQLHERIASVTESGSGLSAMERICDIDLALMLHTYRADHEASTERSVRLSTFGQLAGTIGHELRNPLGVIETSLFVLKNQSPANERSNQHLERIRQQVKLANDIITQLMNLIHDRPMIPTALDFAQVVSDALSSFAEPTISYASTAPLWVDGDAIQLRQVVVNLAQNAVLFAGAEGRVQVELAATPIEAMLTVDDTGPGIDPRIRNRLFEPLVTTRPGGVGLGLAFVRKVVERHGGTVLGSRGPLGGARFTVRLPLRAETV